MRTCRACGVEFELRIGASGQQFCAWCHDDRLRQPESSFERYGLTRASYAERVLAQGGRCAICGREPEATRRLAIDHNHATGVVRGLLCSACNITLGLYERVDPEWFALADRYLKAARAKETA